MSANNQPNPNELGAIWKKEGNGQKFYTGKLNINGEEIQIVMFANTRKEPGSKQPDWRIYRSTRPQNGAAPAPKAAAAPAARTAAAPRPPAAAPRPAAPRPAPRPAPAPAPEETGQEPASEATL